MQQLSGARATAAQWVESRPVQNIIIVLILINGVTLGMETSDMLTQRYGTVLHWLDTLVLSVFVLEIAVKLFAYRWRFFGDAWNVFDFIIVTIALIPSSGPLTVLRVLRLLRLVSMIPRLRMVVEALLRSIPGIASIAGLMVIVFYVFAVMATELFGDSFPQWFGSIGASMYTLFQIMTLESWSMGIVRPVMEAYPYAWVFFVPFILIATFTMLNLFIAIIVNTMQSMHESSHQEGQAAIEDVVHQEHRAVESELRAVQEELQRLREVLEKSRPPS